LSLIAQLTEFSIQNWRQRGTSQHTVNANELCTKALQRWCWFI